MTHHIESLKLENEAKDHKQYRYEKIANTQTILSSDFRSSLSVALMYLENLLASSRLSDNAQKIIIMVIALIN